MNFRQYAFLLVAVCPFAAGQSTTPDVGSGAPTVLIQQQFQLAYYRNGFANLVSYPPLADVKRLGANGLVQEFADAAKTSGVKLALVMPDVASPIVQASTPVFQMQAGLYAYFSQVGVSTSGMPTMDTANCPALQLANSCQYQLFDKPYALFVYKNLVNNVSTTFFTRDPYYTKWTGLGGINALGPAITAETTVTSPSTTKATVQYYDRGVIYSITSGTNTGRLLAVKPPIYALYASNNFEAGSLGLPTSDELVLANGHIRQNFEGGAIEYDPANPSTPPSIRNPVSAVVVAAPANPLRLSVGATATLQATVFDVSGNTLTDRQVLWTTSNGRIVSIQANGSTAILKAAGGGTAMVTATSEGKSSSAVPIVVTSACCQVGEGAPTQAIAQAFQDAVSRSKIAVQLPAASAVERLGAGYVQQLQAAGSSATTYLVAVSDQARTGFVVAGQLLIQYLADGGPAGTLGYPLSDSSVGGRQNFENGALAGSPPQLVTGDILTKWGLLGYEIGLAGAPVGGVTDGLTFRATLVHSQPFQNASLIAVVNGRTTKVFAVGGLVLSKYGTAGGPSGHMGAPLNDEYGINSRRRQDFEGGFIDYAPGDSAASISEAARQPVVTAAPASPLAGTRVRLAVGGFGDGATVRVSITGQADFTVTVANGSYIWESYIPSSSKSSSVVVRAVDAASSAKNAQVTYAIRAVADARLQLTAARGDGQTGPPGALLAAPMVVTLTDENGDPVVGSTVKFTASPGAKIESAQPVTDANGEASVVVRLPAAESVVLVTADSGRGIVTLSARSVHTALANFPKLSQKVSGTLGDGTGSIADEGAMLTAVAAIVRYYQARGDAPMTNGLADPLVLNAYLKNTCAPDLAGVPLCDGFVHFGGSSHPIVNLWRIPSFAGGALDVAVGTTSLNGIRDQLGLGVPVLVAMLLSSGGSHFVVATGVAADASIFIMDPNPALGRESLDAYLTAGAVVTGTAMLLPRPAQTGGFLAMANGPVAVSSASGPCGTSFEIPAQVTASTNPSRVQFRYCDGAASLYELDLSGPSSMGFVLALGPPVARYDLDGSGATSYKVSRSESVWVLGPLDLTLSAGGVLNAASFTGDLAPGGLATIFGAGFGSDAKSIRVDFDGAPGTVLAALPFQVNVAIPQSAIAGPITMKISANSGTAQQNLTLSPVAPAIFTLGASQGAILNRDNTVNGAGNPARRGEFIVVFGTGLGAVVADGSLMRTRTPVTATVGGITVPILFSGLTPGFIGLYQINVNLPASLPPGLTLPLTIHQANSTSNTVLVAVQ